MREKEKNVDEKSINKYLEMPYEIQAKWRMDLFKICVVLAVIGSIAEVVIYLIDSSTRTLFLPLRLYRFRFIYLPTLLNLGMILLTYANLKTKKISNTAKNCWSCVLLLFLCMNTQIIHYVYGPLLALPCLAIFVSILFANKKLTCSISLASGVSIMVACAIASTELRKDDPQLLTDMGLALVIILASYIGASLLIRYVSQQVHFIISSSMRENELLKKLQIDSLMGIYNRSKMESVIRSLITENKPEQKLSLLMLDLDNFKTVNDIYGHLSGDQVLIALADRIRRHGNRNIIPCRYGGEEIIIILREHSPKESYQFAEELLESFRGLRYSFAPDYEVTFSCGIAMYEEGMTRDDWIKLADDHLYQAKALGRNRIYPEFNKPIDTKSVKKEL